MKQNSIKHRKFSKSSPNYLDGNQPIVSIKLVRLAKLGLKYRIRLANKTLEK